MSNLDDIAKKNNYKGIAISVAVHVILLLLFLWVTVWQEPYPPNPEYGIELNFGTSNTGSGQEPVAAEETTDALEEQLLQEATDEAIEDESSSTAEEVVESKETDASAAEPEVQPAADNEATQDVGPIKQEEKTEKAEEKEVTKEKQAAALAADKVKEEIKQAPKANPNALFPGKNNSQGETNKKEGDQGKENGAVDANAIMGPQGGGSGSRLEMSGWAWDAEPRPNDKSDQNGQIVFRIKVDDNGEVINVDVLETTVSPDIVRIYQGEVEKLTFYKTSAGKTLSAYTGKITFLIRSR
jgi:outer membrane biosynthesis protein TonB